MTVRRLTYDTAGMSGTEAFETWRGSGWPGFGGAFQVGGDTGRFFYRAELVPTTRITLSSFAVSGLTWRRPAGAARRDGRDQILVQHTMQGGTRAGEANGVAYRSTPGTVDLVDFSVDIAQSTEDTRAMHLLLSRDLFSPVEAEQVAGPGWARAGGPLLAAFLESLQVRLPGASQSAVARAERAAATVLLACRTGARDAVEEARPELESAAWARVGQHVRTHLTSPSLTPAQIARAAGVSRATLYRLMAPKGGVARYVQQERLDAAWRALLDPLDRRPLWVVARALGFADGAHFSRLFRARYGVRPSDLRPVV